MTPASCYNNTGQLFRSTPSEPDTSRQAGSHPDENWVHRVPPLQGETEEHMPQYSLSEYTAFNSSGDMRVTLKNAANDTVSFTFSGVGASAGQWAFYAVVYGLEGMNVTISVYRNDEGVLNTASDPGGMLPSQISVIGARNTSGSHSFAGAIDDFRIYRKVLSAEDILAIFEGGINAPDITPPSNPQELTVEPHSE